MCVLIDNTGMGVELQRSGNDVDGYAAVVVTIAVVVVSLLLVLLLLLLLLLLLIMMMMMMMPFKSLLSTTSNYQALQNELQRDVWVERKAN